MGETIARRRDDGLSQSLLDHLQGVSTLSRGFAAETTWSDWAFAAGWLHDAGKYSKEYQEYIRRVTSGGERGATVDHSTAGAQWAVKLFTPYIGWLLAYTIAGHHAGLPNGDSSGGLSDRSTLENRLQQCLNDYSAFDDEVLKAVTLESNSLPFIPDPQQTNLGYALFFFVKMLFSCLVDADYLDTEAFMRPDIIAQRGRYPGLAVLKRRFDESMAVLLSKTDGSELNRLRGEIYRDCLTAAEEAPGLFSLTVPTGGGKTLSSLAFALRHALRYNKKRIIYVIPYTSIIEQNALVFREFLGVEGVIEHHSNYEPSQQDDDSEKRWSLAVENWDAPVIVTTNVQFFESLFHHRSSRNRKLHNLIDSVIILDEAQMLPIKLLKPCLAALTSLSSHYGSTVVLCTATQPALTKASGFDNGLEGVREIIPPEKKLYGNPVFKRTEIELLEPLVQTPKALGIRLNELEQVLCIVNTRKHAKRLCVELDEDKDSTIHLSTLMCPAHRKATLKTIRERLEKGQSCRVVSTQLIEAGVDIDFPVVFRALAGADSIAQAAGRCNREGRLDHPGRVFVFRLEDGEPPGLIKQGAQIAERLVGRFGNELLSPVAVEEYFRELYWLQDKELDKLKIGRRLSEGIRPLPKLPFRDIGREFQLIEKNSESVIIPWNKKAVKMLDNLRTGFYDYRLLRGLQAYTVSVYNYEFKRLWGQGLVEQLDERFNVLSVTSGDREVWYKEKVGLIIPDDDRSTPGSMII